MNTQQRFETTIDSPVGRLTLVSDGKSLLSLLMQTCTDIDKFCAADECSDPILREASRQLEAYFRGELREFDLPLDLGGTEFQRRVWRELTCIPYGETISYGELAARVGNPKASRAVGMANHCNPVGIIVPCHRVIGASGKLIGYAGGLWRKQALLGFERAHAAGTDLGQLALQV